ncbi:hypothetical protein BCF46_2886 [Litoreibacter meonggei]|uniref:Uncharacterized protein n=1 Tax=Litoreibacter meonggei TaxID=1049199 RepID=A0A497VKA2_9RHOB|nr:hypothetical protein [Litoreibacter meonggei]RLJ41098.1 hypothetical protein BCF46_2886 [Litoreibacter meonggei]
MQATLYSHRLKTAVQHIVVELGLTLSIDDETSEVSLSDNEATIRETASLLDVQIIIQKAENATTVTFYR